MESFFLAVVLFYLLFALFVTMFFGEEYYSTATDRDRDREVKASSKTKEKLLFKISGIISVQVANSG